MITLEFLITSLIVVLIPGTGVVFTVSAGLVQGRRAGIFASLGCTLGIVPHLLATVLGLAAVMHTSALAFQLLKYAGVAYLLYLAYATWKDRSAFVVQQGGAPRSALSLTVKAFLLNILNPKLTIFFLAFLPQFVDPGRGDVALQFVVLGILSVTLNTAVDIVVACAAAHVRRQVAGNPATVRRIRQGSGATLCGLGLLLALARRPAAN